ncbi:Antigenic thaumatin-like protein [Penicillium rolfsii]|nr:Antigenic thaumatin-like protein [Penicillium rolfsii]
MKFSSALHLICLASFTLAQPTNLEQNDGLPYRITPVPASSSVSLSPSATPTPASTAAHHGHAFIANHCTFPVYIWSVGTVTRDRATLLPGHRYSETFRHDHKAGGIAIKISTEQNGLYESAPLTIFAYNIDDQNVWYDLSDVFGDPFKGYPVSLSPAEPAIGWADGVPPSGSQVRVQDVSENLMLTLC